MHIAMRRLVPQILRDPILPDREDGEGGFGLDEEGPPRWKAGKLPGSKVVVPLLVLEQVEMHRLVGDRQAELLAHVSPKTLQFPDDSVLLGQREVGVDHELTGDDLCAGWQAVRSGPWERHLLQSGRVPARCGGQMGTAGGSPAKDETDEQRRHQRR